MFNSYRYFIRLLGHLMDILSLKPKDKSVKFSVYFVI